MKDDNITYIKWAPLDYALGEGETDHGPGPGHHGNFSRLVEMADVDALVKERGEVYGPPAEDFARVAKMAEPLDDCPDPLARHALYMILVKVSRLIQSPDHADSWADIAGYAKCGAEVTMK